MNNKISLLIISTINLIFYLIIMLFVFKTNSIPVWFMYGIFTIILTFIGYYPIKNIKLIPTLKQIRKRKLKRINRRNVFSIFYR